MNLEEAVLFILVVETAGIIVPYSVILPFELK